jgi:ankyrin repeat protein
LTALHYAARSNNLAIAARLVSAGANVNAKSKSGASPLHRAAYMGHEQMCTYLLANGASALARDDRNKSAADLARDNAHNNVAKLICDKSSS